MQIRQVFPWTAVISFASATIHVLPAQAIGFTGDFKPENWDFTFNGSGNNNPASCYQVATSGCVDVIDDSSAVLGLENDGTNSSYATWSWTNKPEYGATYYVTFDWSVLSGEGLSTSTASINISGIDHGPFSGGDSDSFTDVKVAANQTISFRVEINNAISDPIFLQITNFNAEVPAPLPAAGAATAFGYSRRLRRRIKGKRPDGSCPPVLPAHPSAYLNLAPAALQSVPVSFSYGSHSAKADCNQQAA